MRILATSLLALTVLCGAVHACCIWDNDFLEDEMLPWPDALDTVAGRIERQPAAYYETRLDKALRETLPGGRVHNLVVAAQCLDQLNRQEEAIAMLRPLLDEVLPAAERTSVRGLLALMFTNLWWQGGTTHISPSVCIAEARIHNAGLPRSHFLDAILGWAEKTDPAEMGGMLADMFGLRHAGLKTALTTNGQLRDRGLEGAADVLLAMIRLHPLWENFDTFYTLSLAWAVDGRQALAHMARLRAWELHAQGKLSRVPNIESVTDIKAITVARQPTMGVMKDMTPLEPKYRAALDECYAAYREYGNAWQAARRDYVANTLAAGTAGDDPAFWAGFKVPRPSLPALPRPELIPAPKPIETAPAVKETTNEDATAESEEPDNGTSTWIMVIALLSLLAVGFFVNSRTSPKEPGPTP
ncbi:MAG: hypothetical protein IPK87_04395 [Planctomycetes bacterium]|nr:hypothetical protein [Planctomycetota bacterium]